MLARSGAAAVMIGRAATGRPWLPGAIARALEEGLDDTPTPSPEALARIASTHFMACVDHYGADVGVRTARKHLAAVMEHCVETGCAADRPQLRRALLTEFDPDAVLRLLALWFEETPVEQAA